MNSTDVKNEVTDKYSLRGRVFHRIREDILSGKYTPGEILTELKLVADLGVSRTPIREALRRLEQEHIIEISQKGILIIGVSKKDLKDILEIRIRIEGLAAAEAAKNITGVITQHIISNTEESTEKMLKLNAFDKK